MPSTNQLPPEFKHRPLTEYELAAAEAAEVAYGLSSGRAATMTRLITEYINRNTLPDADEMAQYIPEGLAKLYDDTFFLFFSLSTAKRGFTPATFADREIARALPTS